MGQSSSHPNLINAVGGSPSRQNSAELNSPRLRHEYSASHLPFLQQQHQSQQVLACLPELSAVLAVPEEQEQMLFDC